MASINLPSSHDELQTLCPELQAERLDKMAIAAIAAKDLAYCKRLQSHMCLCAVDVLLYFYDTTLVFLLSDFPSRRHDPSDFIQFWCSFFEDTVSLDVKPQDSSPFGGTSPSSAMTLFYLQVHTPTSALAAPFLQSHMI